MVKLYYHQVKWEFYRMSTYKQDFKSSELSSYISMLIPLGLKQESLYEVLACLEVITVV